MRKIIIITLSLLLCIVSISGCNKTSTKSNSANEIVILNNYETKKVSDSYYLKFDGVFDRQQKDNGMIICTQEQEDLSFDNIDILVQKLKNGSFTKGEIGIITKSFPKDENGVKIFDYNRVYYPVVPLFYSCNCVIWNGDTYSYEYELLNTKSLFYVLICTDQVFNTIMEYENRTLFDNELVSIDEVITQNNKTTYYYSTQYGQFKEVMFSFEKNGIKYTIDESYDLKWQPFWREFINLTVSEIIPSRVYIYMEKIDDGQKAIVSYFNPPLILDYSVFAITNKK